MQHGTQRRALAFGLFLPALATAAPEHVSPTFGGMAVLNMLLGLFCVVGLILGCAWFLKRLNIAPNMRNENLSVLALLNIGQKEKIALIKAGDKQILVGITLQNIRTLHVFDSPVVAESAVPKHDFAKKLHAMLERGEVR
jgi:flagellar protein FliO/FliZ